MTATAGGECSFEVVERVLAERLHGLEPSPALRAGLRRCGWIRWEGVVARASADLVLPAFAAALHDLDLLESLEPELREFLEVVLGANVERNSDLRDGLAAVVEALNLVDIEPVLLKGAVRLVDGLYPGVGWRMMRDLDLLVPKAMRGDAVEALQRVGYTPHRSPPASDHWVWRHHHYPRLARPGRAGTVEIHTELFSLARRRRLLRGAEVLRDSRRVEFDGVRARVPSVDHQMTHLIGHCQVSNRYRSTGKTQLRDLLEAAALDVWSPERLDWQVVCARFAAAGYHSPLISFLLSLEGVGFGPVPAAVKAGLLARLWRRSPADGAGSAAIRRMRLHIDGWAALLGELVLEPEMRRKALRRLAAPILQRLHRGPPRL